MKSYIHDLFPFKSAKIGGFIHDSESNKSGEASLGFFCASSKTEDPPFLKLNVMSGISEMTFQKKKNLPLDEQTRMEKRTMGDWERVYNRHV